MRIDQDQLNNYNITFLISFLYIDFSNSLIMMTVDEIGLCSELEFVKL